MSIRLHYLVLYWINATNTTMRNDDNLVRALRLALLLLLRSQLMCMQLNGPLRMLLLLLLLFLNHEPYSVVLWGSETVLARVSGRRGQWLLLFLQFPDHHLMVLLLQADELSILVSRAKPVRGTIRRLKLIRSAIHNLAGCLSLLDWHSSTSIGNSLQHIHIVVQQDVAGRCLLSDRCDWRFLWVACSSVISAMAL